MLFFFVLPDITTSLVCRQSGMDDGNYAVRGSLHTPGAGTVTTGSYQRHRLLSAARVDETEGYSSTYRFLYISVIVR